MPFELTLHIGGLMALIPRDDGNELWLMMPKTGGGHDHVPAIVYDDGALVEGAPEGNVVWERVGGRLQLIQGRMKGNIRRDVLGMFGHQSRLHGKRAERDWFDATQPSKKLVARACIRGMTVFEPHTGVQWRYGTETGTLYSRAACTIPMPGRSVDVFVEGGGKRTLYARGSSLEFAIMHVPQADLPPNVPDPYAHCPGRDKKPHHWHFFQTLFGLDPANEAKVPLLAEDCPTRGTGRTGTGPEHHAERSEVSIASDVRTLGVSPYSCMMVPGCEEGDPDPECNP